MMFCMMCPTERPILRLIQAQQPCFVSNRVSVTYIKEPVVVVDLIS